MDKGERDHSDNQAVSVLAGASAPLYTLYDLTMAREFVRMWSSSFLVQPSFEIQVHLQKAFFLNQEPRAARPCAEQKDNMRSELSLRDAPEPYLQQHLGRVCGQIQ